MLSICRHLQKTIYLTALIALLFQACGNDTSKEHEASDQGERLGQLYNEFGSEKDQPFIEIVRSRERLIEHWPFVENSTHPFYTTLDFTKDVVLLAQSSKEPEIRRLYIANITAYDDYVEVELALSRLPNNDGDQLDEPYFSRELWAAIYGVGNRPIRFTRTLTYHDSNDNFLTEKPDIFFDPLVWKDETIHNYDAQVFENLLSNNGWVYNPNKQAIKTLDYKLIATDSTVNDGKLYMYKDMGLARNYFNLSPTLSTEAKSVLAVVDNMSFEDISYDHTLISLNYLSADAGCKDLLCEDSFNVYPRAYDLFPTIRRVGYKNDCEHFDATRNDKYAALLTYTNEQNLSVNPVYIQTIRSCNEYTDIVDANMTAWLFENFWDRIYDHGDYW